MKPILLLAVVIILPLAGAAAAGTSVTGDKLSWEVVQTGTFGLKSIHFTDSNNGWIAGGPSLLRTTDSGISWETEVFEGILNLNYVWFYDQERGFVLADDGIVLITENGGETWTRVSTGFSFPLFTGVTSDFKTIYVAGGSRNVARGGIAVSRDSGRSWEPLITGTETFLISQFLDDQSVIFAGSNGTIAIHDPQTGSSSYIYVPLPDWICGLEIDENDIFLATQQGRIFSSSDRGENWDIHIFDDLQFYDAFFNDDYRFIAGYDFNLGLGVLFNVTEDGSVLIENYSKNLTELLAVEVIDDTVWLTGSSGIILKSTSTGNYMDVSVIDTVFNDIYASSEGIWAVGNRIVPENILGYHAKKGFITKDDVKKSSDIGVILHSRDGKKWKIIHEELGTILHSISRTGWGWFVAGYNGTLLVSGDGLEWEKQDFLGISNDLLTIKMQENGIGAVSGKGGFFAITEDGGSSWKQYDFLNNWTAEDFAFGGVESHVIFAGYGGLREVDYKESNQTRTLTEYSGIFFTAITVENKTEINAAGDHGFILYSSQEGTLNQIDGIPNVGLIDMATSDSSVVVVGRIGTIIQLDSSKKITNVIYGSRLNYLNSICYEPEEDTWWIAGSLGIVMKSNKVANGGSGVVQDTITSTSLPVLLVVITAIILAGINLRKRRQY